jgi:hypothetical protein
VIFRSIYIVWVARGHHVGSSASLNAGRWTHGLRHSIRQPPTSAHGPRPGVLSFMTTGPGPWELRHPPYQVRPQNCEPFLLSGTEQTLPAIPVNANFIHLGSTS